MEIFTVYWNVIESNVLGKVSRRAEARGPAGRTKRCLHHSAAGDDEIWGFLFTIPLFNVPKLFIIFSIIHDSHKTSAFVESIFTSTKLMHQRICFFSRFPY